MDVEVLRNAAVVKQVSGDVAIMDADGTARKVKVGDTIRENEIVLTPKGAKLVLVDTSGDLQVDENCVGCIDEVFAWRDIPLQGDIEIDLSQLSDNSFGADDIAAIQEAILAGEDPTQILEATAAGGAGGSANAGFVTIDYNYTETRPSTFFETSALTEEQVDEDNDDFRSDVTASTGGQSVSQSLTEGSISQGTYPQTISTNQLVQSGSLDLDPNSFVPAVASLSSLLSELNSDITSGGVAVQFVYDANENAIVGTQNGTEVLRVDVDTVSSGSNVNLTLTSTISAPIDHVSSVGDGQVSYIDNQITLTFEIEGADIGGNAIATPISASIAILDGADPIPQTVTVTNQETNTTLVEGSFVSIESDSLASVVFDSSSLAQFDGILSDNQNTIARVSDDGTEISLSILGSGEAVLTISVDTDGEYHFQQFKPIEQNSSDTIEFSLPVTITDFDQDTVVSTLNIAILDGDRPTINSVDPISVQESGLVGGSEEGIGIITGTGFVDSDTFSSDIIDHHELEPLQFNTDDSLLSNGQPVSLELVGEVNGVRTYEGFITIEGVRNVVFEVIVDSPALGSYEFTLFDSLTHQGSQDAELSFELPIYAVDADGDRSTLAGGSGQEQPALIVVTVADDVVELKDNVVALDEPTQDGDSAVSYNLFNFTGGDGATVQSFVYEGTTYNLDPDQDEAVQQAFVFDEGTLNVALNGDVTFVVARDIDHSASETITQDITFNAVDGDGDTDSALLQISITDGQIPTINDIPSVSLSEPELASGSSPTGSDVSSTQTIDFTQGSDDVVRFRLENAEFNTDGALTSNGLVVSLKEDPTDSGTYIGFVTDSSNTDTPVFTLAFSDSKLGEYTFTLLGSLDHADGLQNNDLSFELPVYAVDSDGDDSLGSSLTVTIGDDLQTMQNGILTIQEPSLSVLAQGIVTTETINVLPIQGADGASITQFTYDGAIRTLDQNDTGEQEFQFLEGSLFVTLDGDVRFEPNRNLDQTDGDIVKTVVLTSSDGDVDVDTATVVLTITDGDDPTIDNVPSVTLDESGLIDGSAPSGVSVDSNNTISFTEASDDVARIEVVVGQFNQDDSLTSNGLIVEIREEPTGSGNYLGYTTDASNAETPVFTLTFDQTNIGEFTFVLLEAFDHRPLQGNNSLSFDIPILAVDTDGDKTAVSQLVVNINDDVQVMQDVDLTVIEPNLADVSAGTVTTAVVDVLTAPSADGASVTQFTYDGTAYTLDQTSSSEQEFTFTEGSLFITTQGDVRFEPNRDLNHSAGDIVKNIVVTSSDGDDDVLTSTVTLTITDGEVPTIDVIPPVSLSESNLVNGSDPTASAVSDTKVIQFTDQSDDVVSFRIEPTEFNTLSALTSNNLAVQLKEDPTSPGDYIGFVKDASNVETNVFTISFSDTNLGQYTFTLLEPLDHDDGLDNNTLSFDLPVYAVDSDGDDSAMSP
ncbi:retention module-containing protein, partial [Vibrio pelagius]|uniref:retention module-containing protein n=1 Tax=Vibrio pelagius TaxID=28169 RepID=UPI00354CB39E